mgnify:CR=1 FL=1
MKLKFLEDPKKTFGEAEEIKTYARKSFAKDQPEITLFFKNMHYSDEAMTDLLMKMEQNKNKEEVAKQWIKDNATLVNSWFGK